MSALELMLGATVLFDLFYQESNFSLMVGSKILFAPLLYAVIRVTLNQRGPQVPAGCRYSAERTQAHMCGIVGISTSGSIADVAVAPVRRMVSSIAHRGPDDSGLAVVDNGKAILGNTRLAVLDLSSAGHQPMRDESNGNVIVFNGEIYNHQEVRRQLQSVGPPQWNSSSDTETILRAYGVLGESCVDKLRGMFAFCIWDERRGVLFCARDRIGIKPLYYYSRNAGHASVFVFASEVQALLRPGRSRARSTSMDWPASSVSARCPNHSRSSPMFDRFRQVTACWCEPGRSSLQGRSGAPP